MQASRLSKSENGLFHSFRENLAIKCRIKIPNSLLNRRRAKEMLHNVKSLFNVKLHVKTALCMIKFLNKFTPT